MRQISFVLLIIIVTVFCMIFLDAQVLVYLKLNATSIRFDAIFRKTSFSFIQRWQKSSNDLINSLMTSGCFYESNFYVKYNSLLLHNFQLRFGHACWLLFMLILFFLCVLFPMDLASCCLRLPLVSGSFYYNTTTQCNPPSQIFFNFRYVVVMNER